MDDYTIVKLDFEDEHSLDKVVELQKIVYADRNIKFSTGFYYHWYHENPMGNVISFNAFAGDVLVAHYACVPIRMRIDGRIVSGLLDMATVTHPKHRGKGLFKRLAKITYEYAAQNGFEFVVGVANANSFPGYMKYFDFTFVCQLDVKWGWGKIKTSEKMVSGYWTPETLDWRCKKSTYTKCKDAIFGIRNNMPFIKTFMGCFDEKVLSKTSIIFSRKILRPFKLYVGYGANLSYGHYFNFPKFVKHSPFNLIFLDLTDGKLPKVNKENILFQLVDFDVA